MQYELVVIGDDPAADATALEAARHHRQVLLIDPRGGRSDSRGGNRMELAFALRSLMLEMFAGGDPAADQIHIRNLASAIDALVERISKSRAVTEAELQRQCVNRVFGNARFITPHCVEVSNHTAKRRIEAERFVIAPGTKSHRPQFVPFDSLRILDPEEVLSRTESPRSAITVGGGALGIEWGVLLAILGAKVTIVDGCDAILQVNQSGVLHLWLNAARKLDLEFRMGEEVISVEPIRNDRLRVRLDQGASLETDAVVFDAGEVGNTGHLNLTAAGLITDERGRLWCNEHLQTWAEHIYAAGGVVGYPATGESPLQQAHRIVKHAFGVRPVPTLGFRRALQNSAAFSSMATLQ